MPQLAYETLWDTTQFNSMWPTDGSNPLVFSFGEPDVHGYGTHADYMFGWKGDALQRAMNSSCMFTACENGKPLKSQSVAEMNKCAAKQTVKENIDGCKCSLYTLVLGDRLTICDRALCSSRTHRNEHEAR
jgi:hypothetical protein